MSKLSYSERTKNTVKYFQETSNTRLFEVVRKDGKAAKVSWFARMPRDYDNKKCLPWSDVKGRYWGI